MRIENLLLVIEEGREGGFGVSALHRNNCISEDFEQVRVTKALHEAQG